MTSGSLRRQDVGRPDRTRAEAAVATAEAVAVASAAGANAPAGAATDLSLRRVDADLVLVLSGREVLGGRAAGERRGFASVHGPTQSSRRRGRRFPVGRHRASRERKSE